MLKFLKSLFRGKQAVRAALEDALSDQFSWEKTHPIPYTRDQRIVAIAQRAEKLLRERGARPPKALVQLAREKVTALDDTTTAVNMRAAAGGAGGTSSGGGGGK